MGRTSFAFVISQRVPVIPKSGKDGFKQPAYDRGKHTIATSARLLRYRSCVARGMAGSSATGRPGIQDKFTGVAHGCKGK